jgi:DNA-binding helix-hairpin-helix protein with protein kinase domain
MNEIANAGFPDKVVDENNALHRLVSELGRGGQGAVYTTSDPKLLVKLVDAGGHGRDALRRRLEFVNTLPLDNLAIARPGSVLVKEHVGYVMPLLAGMVSLNTLMTPRSSESLAKWYIETGGLKRRLMILARLADTLGRLHALSLTYADLSPHNVFVSESLGHAEVWLIDADNLCFVSSADSRVYTPGWGAPEIVQGRMGNTTLSDIFSFATIAFEVLTTVHPFIGDLVHDGEPELEERAFAGDLPWVDDVADDQNRTERGIPRNMVLTTRLRELFELTLGPGRTDPTARPSMTHWAEALYKAADYCLNCPECGGSYYAPNTKACPLCEHPRPAFIFARSYCWDPEDDEDDEFRISRAATPLWDAFVDSGAEFKIPRRWTAPFLVETARDEVLSASFVRQGMIVEPIDEREYRIALPSATRSDLLAGRKTLPLPRGKDAWLIHCGSMEQPHRILRFTYTDAEAK